jgi:hypothetical protein
MRGNGDIADGASADARQRRYCGRRVGKYSSVMKHSSVMSDSAAALRPQPVLLPDGRQSPVAFGVQRGVRRLFAQLGHATMPEFTLRNGRRVDIIALAPNGSLTIVEIKSSVADFRADRKWPDYEEFCDRFYFAVPETMPFHILPEDRGLIVADSFGAAIMREASCHPLAGARRKAVTLRFAQAAAFALHGLADPDAVPNGRL